jgi:O-antigen/teichoic acid export membrane protein
MAVARKIAYNVAVSSISKVLSTILALVSIAFITRYLGKEGFGNYATVLAFLSFFASVADLGLYSISTREISKEGADEKKIMGNIFALRIASALGILILAPIIVSFFPYPREVKAGIIVVAVSFIFSSSYQVLNGIFQKNLAMDKVAIAELAGKVLQVAFVVLAVKMDWGFQWIIAALLLNMVVSFLIVYLWSKKYLRFKIQFDLNYWKSFLKESAPIGIASVITFAYFKMDTILLSVMKTSSDVGIYNAANKVLENITFFPAMIVGLIFPLMAKTVFTDRKSFLEISNKTFKVFIILIVPLIIGTLFLSDGIIRLIGGGGFAEAAAVLRVLAFSLALIFFGNFFNSVLIAGNLQKKLMLILGFAAIMNIVLNLVFIPKFSYFAAAYISVLTEFIVVAMGFYIVSKKLDYFPKAEKLPGIFVAGAAMASFLFLFKQKSFIFLLLASSLIYFFFLWLLKAIKTEEIKSLISKKGVQEYGELELP